MNKWQEKNINQFSINSYKNQAMNHWNGKRNCEKKKKKRKKYSISVDTALVRKIPIITKDASEYLCQCNDFMQDLELSFEDFKIFQNP